MQIHALMVAAGRGRRFGGEIPKQYLPIDNHQSALGCVLEQSVRALAKSTDIQKLTLVVAKEDSYIHKLSLALPVTLVMGGDERWQSVANGVQKIAEYAKPDDWVLIHDAARPCLQLADLQRLIEVAKLKKCGAILGVPVADTLKKVQDNKIQQTINRQGLWQAQTPQIFPLGQLLQVMDFIRQSARTDITDEAMGFEAMGLPVCMVAGSPSNIKLTFAHDLPLVRALLAQSITQ